MNDSSLGASLASMRLPFLTLPPVCVALGTAVAAFRGFAIDPVLVALVLVGALAAHAAVNALNEYHDLRSGLDMTTQRTPFSGGSGYLPTAPHRGPVALATGLGALAVTVGLGLYFVHLRGSGLLPLGLLGLFVIAAYTPWLTRAPISCLVAPGLGFGPLMVMGTEFVLTGQYSPTGLLASAVPFFLVSDLLLINQFPDVEPDRQVGRRHLPILVGRRAAAYVYALFLGATYAAVVAGVVIGLLPVPALLALLALVVAVPTGLGAIRSADDIPALIPHMGRNVVVVLVTPLLLAAGIFAGQWWGM